MSKYDEFIALVIEGIKRERAFMVDFAQRLHDMPSEMETAYALYAETLGHAPTTMEEKNQAFLDYVLRDDGDDSRGLK